MNIYVWIYIYINKCMSVVSTDVLIQSSTRSYSRIAIDISIETPNRASPIV